MLGLGMTQGTSLVGRQTRTSRVTGQCVLSQTLTCELFVPDLNRGEVWGSPFGWKRVAREGDGTVSS